MIQYGQIVDLYMCLHRSGKRTQFIIARTNDPHNVLKEACFPNGCVHHIIDEMIMMMMMISHHILIDNRIKFDKLRTRNHEHVVIEVRNM